ncbi:hypothetical protein NQZ68_013998 [Dissostichus eleginoides]|nr:hypothetical protein NQZ68_013998 [Dissostichus eleginoides]
MEVSSSSGCLLAAWLVSFCQTLLAKFKWASDVAVAEAALDCHLEKKTGKEEPLRLKKLSGGVQSNIHHRGSNMAPEPVAQKAVC